LKTKAVVCLECGSLLPQFSVTYAARRAKNSGSKLPHSRQFRQHCGKPDRAC
jgi:hypothetical protein